ncbi:VOC family protein [Terrarubrum flagellatum]|uniref:VOC family protein n=1 Tax=Terrirubrum flagellatum TaxID=2895980 RepID=UPI0031450E33
MPNPNFLLLFVDSPKASADFYAGLFDRPPVESSPTFAMFALESGLMLGLWSRHTAEPRPAALAGGGELGLTVADAGAVDATFSNWKARGVSMLQQPTDMDFGRTFVALDPDGHRLRVFSAPQG